MMSNKEGQSMGVEISKFPNYFQRHVGTLSLLEKDAEQKDPGYSGPKQKEQK